MKQLTAILIMVCLCGVALFAQELEESTGESIMAKKGFLSTIINGFAESTRTIHVINKENIASVKEESRANFEVATAPNAGLAKFNETKGFWNKVMAIFDNIKESANANTEKEELRRKEIQNHDSYRKTLEARLTNRQSTTTR